MKTVHLLLTALLWPVALPLASHGQTFVDLESAATFGVLAKSTITSTGLTVVEGDLGLSGASVTGFGPGVVTGTIHFANTTAAQALVDATVAYDLIAGQTATVSGVANFADTTLTPGVYSSASSLLLSGIVTLDGQGSSDSVFIFQMGSTLTTAVDSRIILLNGARADRIFWQVGSSATLGVGSVFAGNLLAHTSITMNTGASIDGRLMALDGAISLSGTSITVPASAIPEPAATTLLVATLLGAMACIHKVRSSRTGRTPA